MLTLLLTWNIQCWYRYTDGSDKLFEATRTSHEIEARAPNMAALRF